MKEIIGIFAAIAAVAGIASAISKNGEDEEAEQRKREQELELEQQRLQLEAEQNAQRQQMELQRLRMEQQQQEYQRKLANAPKKPIYKPVGSLTCPLCMGHREVNEAAGEIQCPYCGGSEQMVVDHYEIDQVAFQRQLEEEQRQMAEAAALKKKNDGYDALIATFAIITGLAAMCLCFAPWIGSLFFIPSSLLLVYILCKRFPNKGEKVWGAIRFPLLCIALFPLPLSVYIMKNDKLKARFSTIARVFMSIGTWLVYLAMICLLGWLYIQGIKKEMAPSGNNLVGITQYDPEPSKAESSSATAKTTQTKTESSKKNTTVTTTANQEPSKGKELVAFFDENTNQEIQLGNTIVPIPKCWSEKVEEANELMRTFDDVESDSDGKLILYLLDFPLSITTPQDEQRYFEQCAKELWSGIFVNPPDSVRSQTIDNDNLNGILSSGSGFWENSDHTPGQKIDSYLTMFFDYETRKCITITLLEKNEAAQSHQKDFISIINSIRYISTDIASDENNYTTAISTIPEAAAFSQEDALRAAVVAITNALATDVFSSDGSRHDTSKYHAFSDTSAFYMDVLSRGTWTEKSSNTWHVEGLRLQPDGYDRVYNTPINVDTVAKVSLDVSFDGTNYIITNISGMYAIPGREEIGTNLSYLNSDSLSRAALTVSQNMIDKGR